MFDEYLNDEQCYVELERYILDRFFLECDANGVELKEFKVPFYNTAFSNGTPFREGNPIFSARNEVAGTILRIVLEEDTDSLVSYRDKDMGCELCHYCEDSFIGGHHQKMAEWVRSQ